MVVANDTLDGLPARDHDFRRLPRNREVTQLIEFETHDLAIAAIWSPYHGERAV
jgi:hypothetical protein